MENHLGVTNISNTSLKQSCCICGPAKNVGKFLPTVLKNMEKLGTLFDDYVILIYYDTSTDNTLQVLKDYQKEHPKMIFYVNRRKLSPYRTHNIAAARNFCLQYVRERQHLFPFFIMMDLDDVNCKSLCLDPLKRALTRTDWDALSFTTHPFYYDIWALSIWPFCFSYNHFQNNYAYHTIIREYIMQKLTHLPPGQLLPCISSFNGFSIYRTSFFLRAYYDGRVRLDLFPTAWIRTHARAQQSPRGVVYKNYGHIEGREEDCEHRSFHQMARYTSGAKIRIAPEVLFCES